jgi:outer membrane protein OmpA-like peptidoglycan-associated protein
MRTSLFLVALVLIPVFAGVTHWHFHRKVAPALQREMQMALKSAGLTGVKLQLIYLDVLLGGRLNQPAQRDLAEKVVRAFPGVRLLPQANRIKVNAALEHRIEDGVLHLSGWLPGVESRNALVKWATEFRPDLRPSLEEIELAPHVELAPETELREGKVTATFADMLEAIRLPASLSIERQEQIFQLSGVVPTEEMKAALVSTVRTAGWEVEASRLLAIPSCGTAPFLEGDALFKLVEALFASPSPGDFSIDKRSGVRLKAYATAAMEAAWRTLLQPLLTADGEADLQITRVASAFQFPDYRPQSTLPSGMEKSLRHLFNTRVVYFEPKSAEVRPQELEKLSSLVAAMVSAGPEAQFLVAGYCSEVLEPGFTPLLRVQRAEAVRTQLVAMGVAEEVLETSVFEAVLPMTGDVATMDRETRKVEIFLK